jgi:hypothetical protein
MTISLYQGTLAFDGNASVDLAVVEVDGSSLKNYGSDATRTQIRQDPHGQIAEVGPFGAAAVTWKEYPGREVTLASRTLDTSLLETIAEGVRIGDTDAAQYVYLDQLPDAIDGFRPTATVHNVELGGWLTVSRNAHGHQILYRQDDDLYTLLGTAVADSANLAVITWMINGKPAYAGDRPVSLGWAVPPPDDPPTLAAAWDRGDGTIGYITATDTTETELLGVVADTMREADSAEWDGLKQEGDR